MARDLENRIYRVGCGEVNEHKYDDFQIIVDKKHRVVIVKNINMYTEIAEAFSKKFDNLIVFNFDLLDKIIPKQLKVVAKCHEDDVWNEKVGIEIAMKKYKMKYRATVINILNHIYADHCKRFTDAYDLIFDKYVDF